MIDTEEKAKQKILDTWNAKELFIILSESQYHDGRSVPRAFQVSADRLFLSIFTTYEAAAEFCRADNYIRDGKPLIGRIDNGDKLRDLYSILNTALYMGIGWTDIDCSTENAMGVKIGTMFEWGGRKLDGLSMLMPKEEFERVQASGKINLQFNRMPLYER